MRKYIFIIVAIVFVFAMIGNSRASTYQDATNDLFTVGAPQLDISSVAVTNDSTNLYFTINVVGNPILTNWGSYAIALVTWPGGATNGNGSGAAISLTEGINYWATCLGWGSPQLWQYNTNTMTWTNIGGVSFANSSNSVSLTLPLAKLGLSSTSSFQFDAYTFSGTGGAMDDLANTNVSVTWWSNPYSNNLVAAYNLTGSVSPPASGTMSVNVLEDTNTIIWRNPGKGWVSYNALFPTSLPASEQAMINLLYQRYDWSDIQPTEGTFNWSLIDNAITSAKANGVKFAFGIMNCDVENYISANATPQWVFNAGAGYYVVGPQQGWASTNYNVPYWSTNSIFFAKMNAFITALGQRYNGNTNVAFVDVLNYGEWGEQHLGNINVATNGQVIPYISVGELETNYLKPYLNAFPNTHLLIPWGAAMYNPGYNWVIQQGAGMRRDGIPKYTNGLEYCTYSSGTAPAVIEYYDGYDNMVTSGWWSDSVVSNQIILAKASYSEISWGSFLPTETNFMATLQNQMGYHFVLQNVTIPQWLSSVSSNSLAMNWSNKGITYLYEPCSIAMALLDSGNNVIGKSWLSGVNPQLNWAPGLISVTNSMSFPSLAVGSYKLAVGLFTSTNQTQPNFMLGNLGRTANGWYVITNVSLLNIAQPATNPTNLTAVLTNGILSLAWPADHTGWTLQMQTNNMNSGLGTNWVTVANSSTTNQMAYPISQTSQTVFFRLKY